MSSGPPREILPGGRKTDTGRPRSWDPRRNLNCFLYSNSNKKRATLLRFANRIIGILQGFFKENVTNPVWICRDPISLILETRFFSDFRDPMIIFSYSRDPI